MNLDALYQLTHGLYVLGASDGDRLAGSVVDAVMQVASSPVAIALSCTNRSYTKSCIDKPQEFSLSVLCKNVNPFVIANFGYQSSRNIDKWKNVEHFVKDGLPYLTDNLAMFRCRVIHSYAMDSNTLYIAGVLSAEATRADIPLTYLDYRSYFKQLVLESFNTYTQKQKGTTMTDTNKKWVCTVCGYVYDGDIPFENLPEDYVCPLCGVGKELFVQQDA